MVGFRSRVPDFGVLGAFAPGLGPGAGVALTLELGVRGSVRLPVASVGFLAFPSVLSRSVLGRLVAFFTLIGYVLLTYVCLCSSHTYIERSKYCVGSFLFCWGRSCRGAGRGTWCLLPCWPVGTPGRFVALIWGFRLVGFVLVPGSGSA